MSSSSELEEFNDWVASRNPGQTEFLQAVTDIAADVMPVVADNDNYSRQRVLYRLAEPDRIISFRISWEDDNGDIQINRGWRVQQSNVLGPYKGGLRFHPQATESIFKFLAFEQCFKNALTGLSLGGGKGGSDFDPKGRSEREIMRFCQAFMLELHRHIGPTTDVPAGDINVGKREIGFLYGQYRRIANEFVGSLTGKKLEFGGSQVREEATGYGVVYFAECVLATQGDEFADKRVAMSGAGNVALHAASKASELGASVISLSNSRGCLLCEDGFSGESIQRLIDDTHSENPLAALAESGETQGVEWLEGEKPWNIDADIAMPCATQNEVEASDARAMLDGGVRYLIEGANMPLTGDAGDVIRASECVYVPGKASNAGGVAMSGFEMGQNAQFHQLPFEQLDRQLKQVMQHIHRQCLAEGRDGSGGDKKAVPIDYARGANIASFRRLADAIVAQGY